jgi:anti-anti-sigma regulatory factor
VSGSAGQGDHRVLGEHDLTTATAVEDCLEGALAGGSVVVDLSAAALIDCSILAVLSHAADRPAATAWSCVRRWAQRRGD